MRSLLDRLVDEEPEREHDPPVTSHAQALREHRDAVMRDVSNLLNTRRPVPGPPKDLTGLFPSLADYGTEDFQSANLATASAREKLRKTIEEMIRRYEPRFKRVDVHLMPIDPLAPDRTVKFRIEALLHAEPAPVAISFDSVMDPINGGLEVAGRRE
jgi:type VI secretion system protein ImpF